jgi:hypothetical protein
VHVTSPQKIILAFGFLSIVSSAQSFAATAETEIKNISLFVHSEVARTPPKSSEKIFAVLNESKKKVQDLLKVHGRSDDDQIQLSGFQDVLDIITDNLRDRKSCATVHAHLVLVYGDRSNPADDPNFLVYGYEILGDVCKVIE